MRSSRPLILRLVTLLTAVVLVIHWNACFYLALSDYIGQGSDGWVYSMYSLFYYQI